MWFCKSRGSILYCSGPVLINLNNLLILQLSAQWPGLWMAARLDVTLFWYRPHCFCCINQVLNLTSGIFMTKAERSVSKQGHLQPRFHSKARSYTEQITVKCSIFLLELSTKVVLYWVKLLNIRLIGYLILVSQFHEMIGFSLNGVLSYSGKDIMSDLFLKERK